MVVVNTPSGDVKMSVGNLILSVLDDMREFPKHDWDFVNLVVGNVGDGKTSFVKLCSLILDPDITENQWAYSAEQFEKIVDQDLEPGSNIVWDESDELTESWNSKIIQTMSRKFKRIRKKRYVIWLITPTFFDMRKFFVITRANCLWDVYANPMRNEAGKFEANRGYVRFFNKNKKRQLYIRGVKEWNMNAVLPDFRERFGIVPSNYPIDNNVLEAKKDEAMKGLLEDADKPTVKLHIYREDCVSRSRQALFSNYGVNVSSEVLSWIFKVSPRQIRRDIESFNRRFALGSNTGGDVVAVGDVTLLEQKQSFVMPKKAEPEAEEIKQ